MTARIIDGKAIAAELRAKVADEVQRLVAQHGVEPGLAVVLAGNNPASEVYVAQQGEADGRGRHALVRPPAAGDVEPGRTAGAGRKLNADPAVHGILVQLPLPPQIDAQRVLNAIDPGKDVDGFHPVNAGRLATGSAGAGALHAARLHACWRRRCILRSPAWTRW